MTPSRPSWKGSTPAIEIVEVGARRLPERSRRRVVLPAPFADWGVGAVSTGSISLFGRLCWEAGAFRRECREAKAYHQSAVCDFLGEARDVYPGDQKNRPRNRTKDLRSR